MIDQDAVKKLFNSYWVIDNDGRELKWKKMIEKETKEIQKIMNAWLN